MYQMSVVMANAYTNAISDNVKRSVNHKLNNGECIQKAPVGYSNIRDANGKSDVIVDESRAYLVIEMFKMYSLGSTSLGELATFAEKHNLTNNLKNSTKPLSKNVIADFLRNSFYYGEIYVKKTDKYYPHKYQTLITKDLFDECQRVTSMRSIANNRIKAVQSSRTGKNYIFRGLIRCEITGGLVTTDGKLTIDGNNNHEIRYLQPHNPDNIKKYLYIREDEILKQVEAIFKSIQLPPALLKQITEHLKKSHESEVEYHKAKMGDINRELGQVQSRIEKLIGMHIDGAVDKILFDRKKAKLDEQMQILETDREMHKTGDSKFKDALITAFKLTTQAHDIFLYSKNEEKRQLINYVFSNLTLTGKEPCICLRKPFNLMVNLSEQPTWLPIISEVRTIYFDRMKAIGSDCGVSMARRCV